MCIGGSVGKESACNAGNPGSIPGWGRSLGEGNGNCPAAHMVHWTQGRLGATREDWKKTQGAVGTADKFIFSGQQQQQSSSSESSKTTDIQDRQKWPLASGHAGPVLPRSAI